MLDEVVYLPVPDFQRTLSNLTNPELLEMADEGLVLAARAKVRLGQSLSAAQHTEGHLQVVGVGEWRPTSTRPRGTPSLASLILRTRSRNPSSDAERDGLIH